jgi:hypothetical protein
MLHDINLFLFNSQYVTLFISHLIIFVGGFYVAMHSRIIPTWVVTCIWYVGLSSLFTLITIIIELTLGMEHPLSLYNLRVLAEFLPLLSIAITVFLLFINTLCTDVKCRKLRKTTFKK